PSAAEPTPGPRLTVARPQPVLAPEVSAAPPPPAPVWPVDSPAPRAATWLIAVRQRPWLAVSVALSLVGVSCFIIAHALSARPPGRSAPPVATATRPTARPTVDPLPAARHAAEAKPAPVVADGRGTGERRKV